MRRVLGPLLVLGLVLPSICTAAGAYKWIDKNGQTVYSDQPPQPGEVGPQPETVPAPSATAPAPVGPATAIPRRPIHPAASELIELSGLKEQAKGIVLQSREDIRQRLGHLEPRDVKSVDAVTAQTLDADRVVARIVDELSQVMDDTKIPDVRAWYRAPLGRRITELDVRSSATPAAERRRHLTAFVAEWRATPPAPARVALVQRLDAAAGATDLSVDVVVGIAQAITRGADPMLPPERRLQPGQLEAQARQIRLAVQERFRQANTVAILYMYREVSDADLLRYIRFLESDAGAWYGGAVRRSLVQALASSVGQTITELARVVPPQRWGTPGTFKKPPLPAGERTL